MDEPGVESGASLLQTAMCRKILLGCAGILMGCLAQAADLKIQAEAAFVGFGASTGTTPVAVTLLNSGQDARGSLRVTSGSFQMDYPIELPRGTTKRLVIYPETQYGGEVALDLDTNRGGVHGVFRQLVTADSNAQTVLLVGDNQGELGFLRPRANETVTRMWDCYVKPELAPDRLVAYSGIRVVVLGPGAERLPDSAVRALHLYLSSGGTIAFLGGASSPTLSDRRWADVTPVFPKLPKMVAATNLVKASPIETPFSILTAKAAPAAAVQLEGGEIMVARRNTGLGTAVFLAFNPLEAPFTRWSGRRALFEKVLRPVDSARAAGYLKQFTDSTRIDEDPYARYYGRYSQPDRADPFSTQLPAPSKVLWILASYFVVIIPINFLLLRKLKKGELAWLTAPLISVGFAGAFFAAASDLYTTKLSKATQGLIIATSNGTDSVFIGKTQLFFPQGGEYNLQIDGLDKVGSPTDPYDYGYGYRGNETLENVNPIDVGRVMVSHMDVNSLAFREMAYQQIIPAQRWFDVQLNGRKLVITNRSGTSIEQPSVIVAGKAFPIAHAIAPQQSEAISLPETIQPDESDVPEYASSYNGQQIAHYSGLAQVTETTKEIVVKGTVADPPVGPKIGSEVKARQKVMIAYFSGLHYGRPGQ